MSEAPFLGPPTANSVSTLGSLQHHQSRLRGPRRAPSRQVAKRPQRGIAIDDARDLRLASGSLLVHAHMSCPETLVIRRGYAGHLVEDTVGGSPVGRKPTETCLRRFNKYHRCKAIHSHAIRSFGERLNNKLFVLHLPSSYDVFRIRVNDSPNIVRNIFLLSTLVMKGYSPRC